MVAEMLSERGARVILAAPSNDIHGISDELGSDALAVETDVTDKESVRKSVAETVRTFGGLDCLVNIAGIAGPTVPVKKVEDEMWKRTLDVNVSGGYRTVRYAPPNLRDSDRDRIINIASISGKRPLENRTPYATLKMAMIRLTRTLAVEFSDDGVTVNAICPGVTEGPRLDDVLRNQAGKADRSREAVKQTSSPKILPWARRSMRQISPRWFRFSRATTANTSRRRTSTSAPGPSGTSVVS